MCSNVKYKMHINIIVMNGSVCSVTGVRSQGFVRCSDTNDHTPSGRHNQQHNNVDVHLSFCWVDIYIHVM